MRKNKQQALPLLCRAAPAPLLFQLYAKKYSLTRKNSAGNNPDGVPERISS
jgi:hypothetical protein